MSQPDERDREIAELRRRLSRLSEAGLRINESLDFDTVLQEVVDSARALTASRYGAITIPGEVFRRPTFIVSGLTEEEHQGFWDMPGGCRFEPRCDVAMERCKTEYPARFAKAATGSGGHYADCWALKEPEWIPSRS